MKKYLIFFVGILSFLFVNEVKADTYDFYHYREDVPYLFNDYNVDFNLSSYYDNNFINTKVNNLINYWEENYKNEGYAYYVISIRNDVNNDYSDLSIYLVASKSQPINYSSLLSMMKNNDYADKVEFNSRYYHGNLYDSSEITSSYFNWSDDYILFNFTEENEYYYLPSGYYQSNFDIIYDLQESVTIEDNDVTLATINTGDVFPTYKELSNSGSVPNNYTEINLNDYPYVALSLKDYTSRNEFSTNVYVKGQYCLTSVYNYGTIERKDVLTGSKMQSCTPVYEDFTKLRSYVLKSDIDNHAIYYLKAYDTSIDNIVRVDNSVFNIHYITSEDENNPILNINGRNYTSIPYSELTDTATKSEEEGYVSGVTCTLGDINCISQNSNSYDFSDLFKKPLETLTNIWDVIVQIFALIGMFYALLPVPLQSFLFLSFSIAIILGVIKIIL